MKYCNGRRDNVEGGAKTMWWEIFFKKKEIVQIRSSTICFCPRYTPTPPLTFTTAPTSTPLKSTVRPVAVKPIGDDAGPLTAALMLADNSGSDSAPPIGGAGAWSPQVTSIVAPLLSSSRMIQRAGYTSRATTTPTSRTHFMGWLR